MYYYATLTLDYTRTRNNEYQKLIVALEYAGWDHTETSAMIYQGDDFDVIRRGLVLLGKAADLGGDLSALGLQVVGGEVGPYPTTRNPANAYRQIMELPDPG